MAFPYAAMLPVATGVSQCLLLTAATIILNATLILLFVTSEIVMLRLAVVLLVGVPILIATIFFGTCEDRHNNHQVVDLRRGYEGVPDEKPQMSILCALYAGGFIALVTTVILVWEIILKERTDILFWGNMCFRGCPDWDACDQHRVFAPAGTHNVSFTVDDIINSNTMRLLHAPKSMQVFLSTMEFTIIGNTVLRMSEAVQPTDSYDMHFKLSIESECTHLILGQYAGQIKTKLQTEGTRVCTLEIVEVSFDSAVLAMDDRLWQPLPSSFRHFLASKNKFPETGGIMSQALLISKLLEKLEGNPGLAWVTEVIHGGCSRSGKIAMLTALVSGRVTTVGIYDSGIGGAALLRMVDECSETVASIARRWGRWVATDTAMWLGIALQHPESNTDPMDIDTDSILAALTQRPVTLPNGAVHKGARVMITSSKADFWANPLGTRAAVAIAQHTLRHDEDAKKRLCLVVRDGNQHCGFEDDVVQEIIALSNDVLTHCSESPMEQLHDFEREFVETVTM